jgi:hypothetical protein
MTEPSHTSEAQKEDTTEVREVRVSDPSLSDKANEELTEEVRAVVGSDQAEVPVRTPHESESATERESGLRVSLKSDGLLVAYIGAGLFMVGVIASLATRSWWFLLLALGVHAIVSAVILGFAMRTIGTGEHVAPTTAAHLQDEGVSDPDRRLQEAVQEFQPDRRGG